MILFKEKENFSMLFLLPLIDSTKNRYDKLIGTIFSDKNSNYVNCYFYDINKPWFNNHVFIVFNADKTYQIDKKNLYDIDCFVIKYTYRINKIFYDIYVYEIQEKYIEDYGLILNGLFTDINDNTKKHILNFWIRNEKHTVYDLLYVKNDVKYSIEEEYIQEIDIIQKWQYLI